MPSLADAADLERVLWRAAQECETKAAWFGPGLPQLLRRSMGSPVEKRPERPPELAFVELSVAPGQQAHPGESMLPPGCLIVGLSTSGLEDLPALLRSIGAGAIPVSRLICAVAVFDFTADGLRVREIRHGLTAADLQRQLAVPLWSGPDLKELGTH